MREFSRRALYPKSVKSGAVRFVVTLVLGILAMTVFSSRGGEVLAYVASTTSSSTTQLTTSTTGVPSTVTQTPSTEATVETAPETKPVTSAPANISPVATQAPGSAHNTDIYIGYLATLTRDQIVHEAAAPQPEARPNVLPLTGLMGQVPQRPAAIVKVDNSQRARPQTGLNAADIVIEEEVEGGITRLAAVFHSNSSDVGPVRSGRTTDIGIINGFGSPLLLYSGANGVTDALLRQQSTVQNRNAGTSSGYWRNKSRRAPSNLYTDVGPHWASATGGPPNPQFEYRQATEPLIGSDSSTFTVAYRASPAAWDWNGAEYLRKQGSKPHLVAGGEQVSAVNVVVVEAQEVSTGMVDSSGANVPEFVFVGQGKATVFTAGKRIDAIWTRPTLASAATLTTADGSVVKLTPGRTWIELIKADSGMLR